MEHGFAYNAKLYYRFMRIIAITLPELYPGEGEVIMKALDGGYHLVHLRKPEASEQEMAAIIESLPEKYRSRLVLHSHFHLAGRYGVYGIHLNSRCSTVPEGFKGSISRSCHSLDEVEKFKENCDYLFLSPIFDSISKQGYRSAFTEEVLREAARKGIIDDKVCALGGVHHGCLQFLEELGFGGAAMLGSVWGKLVTPPVVLTVAGSDSSGGAGIQADIKTISAYGCYAASAITAVTAQNTQGVADILGLSPDMVRLQMTAVFEDLHVDAVKIGMVYDTEIVHAIADVLRKYAPPFVVCDPVMIATSGAMLIKEDTVRALEEELFPISTLITPNLHEASMLTGRTVKSVEDMRSASMELHSRYGCSVLVKGGHLAEDRMCDVLCHEGEIYEYTLPRVKSGNLHGTGCTLSSAMASSLAKGASVTVAVGMAKEYVQRAISCAAPMNLGKGGGALWHFYNK